MTNDRLPHLQKLIQGYYEQLAGLEESLLCAEDTQHVRIKQLIRRKKGEIAEQESQYWNLLKSQTAQLDITDADAEEVNADIIQNVEILESETAVHDNAELIKLLNEIKAELTKPEIPASGKLKTAIPLLPGLLSYEMELDTEGLLQRLSPTFSKLAGKLKKTSA
jgi:hypothetical protein